MFRPSAQAVSLRGSILHCHSADDVKNYIEENPVRARNEARTEGYNTLLPIQLVRHLKLDAKEKDKITRLLLDITCPQDMPVVSEKIDSKEQVANNPSSDPKLINLACSIMNCVRSNMPVSYTHPSMNHYSKAARIDAIEILDNARIKGMTEATHILLKDPTCFYQYVSQSEQRVIIQVTCAPGTYLDYIDHSIKYNLQFGHGNCLELAMAALQMFISLYPHVKAGVYSLHGGDHIVLVLKKNLKTREIADEDIICDVWAGKIVTGANYLQRLSNYKTIEVQLNGESHCYSVTPKIDPRRHKLIPYVANNQITLSLLRGSDHAFLLSKINNPKDFLRFKVIVQKNLTIALEKRLVMNIELPNCIHRMAALCSVFSHSRIMDLFERKLFSLSNLDVLTDEEVTPHLNALCAKYLSVLTLNNLFNQRRQTPGSESPHEMRTKASLKASSEAFKI